MSVPHETPVDSYGHDTHGGVETGAALLDFLVAFNGSARRPADQEGDASTPAKGRPLGEGVLEDGEFEDWGFEDGEFDDGEFEVRPGFVVPYELQFAARVAPPAGSRGSGFSKSKLAALVIAIAAVASGGLVALQATHPEARTSLAGLSATQILQASVTAAIRSGSTHLFETDSRGSLSAYAIGDVSVAGGTLRAAIGASSLQMSSVNGQLFMLGDAASLRSFGFTPSGASRCAGLWISVPPNNRAIQGTVEDLQLTPLVDDLIDLSGPLSVVSAPAPGEIALIGSIPANVFNNRAGAGDRATLTISTSYPYLPLSLSYGDTQTGSTVDTFSSWGEKVAVPPNPLLAPVAAVPLAIGA